MTDRDNYFRCKICKKLNPDPDPDTLTEEQKAKGYVCENRCVESFTQPPYQSPLISDEADTY